MPAVNLPTRPPQFGGALPSRIQAKRPRDMTAPRTTKTILHEMAAAPKDQ